ncbi:unnamed protein product [Prorocentrum cordatum]|uniref:Uncharacterized protein n=1 Tax=Prorocentrum cordatum TaxID=2364126 RepID=A0ABN9V7E8_9DINO|nr:unnamed protein product [Polarella glacialis]
MIDCFLHTSSLSAHSVGQRKTPRGARPASKTPGHPAGRCRPFVPAARAGRLVRVGAEHRGPPRRSGRRGEDRETNNEGKTRGRRGEDREDEGMTGEDEGKRRTTRGRQGKTREDEGTERQSPAKSECGPTAEHSAAPKRTHCSTSGTRHMDRLSQ